MLRIIFLLGSGGGFGRECAYSKGVREWEREREYSGRNRVFRTLQIYSCQIVFSALWVWIICLRYTDKLWRRIDRYFELVEVCTHCCAVLQQQFYRRNMFLNCKIRGNMFQHSHYTKTTDQHSQLAATFHFDRVALFALGSPCLSLSSVSF